MPKWATRKNATQIHGKSFAFVIQGISCGRYPVQRMGYTANRFYLAGAAVPQAVTGHMCEVKAGRLLIAEIVMGMLLLMPLGCMNERDQKPLEASP